MASKLAEAEHPAACPPQWLPVLLATLESPTSFELEPWLKPLVPDRPCNDSPFGAPSCPEGECPESASIAPGIVSFNGVPMGWPAGENCNGTLSNICACDVMVAVIDPFGPDETVRGVSTLVGKGFSLGILGKTGDRIEFRYYSAAQDTTYYSDFRWVFEKDAQIGSFSDTNEWPRDGSLEEWLFDDETRELKGLGTFVLPLTLNATRTAPTRFCGEFPPCGTCTAAEVFFAPGFAQVFNIPTIGSCVPTDGPNGCVEPAWAALGWGALCYTENSVPLDDCYHPCVPPPPNAPPPSPNAPPAPSERPAPPLAPPA